MKKSLVSLVLVMALLMVTMIPVSAFAITKYYVKTNQGGPIGVWLEKSTHSEKLGSVPYGKEVAVEAFEGNGWAKIVYGSYGSAYVHAEYLTKTKPGKFVPADQGTETAISYKKFTPAYYEVTVVPTSTFVNFRWSPSTKSANNIQDRLFFGQHLWVLASNGTWSQVYDDETHRSGFVQSMFLKPIQ